MTLSTLFDRYASTTLTALLLAAFPLSAIMFAAPSL